jgi:Zn-finger protein
MGAMTQRHVGAEDKAVLYDSEQKQCQQWQSQCELNHCLACFCPAYRLHRVVLLGKWLAEL